jgi:ribosomal protein L2
MNEQVIFMAQPEWLQANKQVYSKEHGVIHIAAIIDENLYFKKGNVNQILFDWKQEVNNGNLLPIHEAPSGKSVLAIPAQFLPFVKGQDVQAGRKQDC